MTTRNAARMRPRALLFAGVMLSSSVAQAQYINLPGTQPGGLADGAPLDNARACGVTCHFSRDATMPSTMATRIHRVRRLFFEIILAGERVYCDGIRRRSSRQGQ